MRHYRATNLATGEVVEYDADLPQQEHRGEGWNLEDIILAEPTPDAPPPVLFGPRRVTKLQFIERLGDVPFATILQLAKQSVEVEAFVKRFEMTTPDPDGTSIDLTDPRTVAGVTDIGATLVQLGAATEAWADEVLNG